MIKVSVECDDCGRVGCIVQITDAQSVIVKGSNAVSIAIGDDLLQKTVHRWTEGRGDEPFYGQGVLGDRLICPRCQRESKR